jgi:hypothetical protein
MTIAQLFSAKQAQRASAFFRPRRRRKAPTRHRKFLLEPLEQRLLLDIDPLAPQLAALQGALDVPGETDRYTFSLTAEKRLLFDTSASDASIYWSLEGPRGQEVADRPFAATGWSGNPTVDLVPGDYTLTVDGTGDATGSYAFRILDLAAAPVLPLGTPATATLDPGNITALCQFPAQAGDKVYFDSQNITGTVYHTLLDPYAQPVFAKSPAA